MTRAAAARALLNDLPICETVAECGKTATHREPDSGLIFCRAHASSESLDILTERVIAALTEALASPPSPLERAVEAWRGAPASVQHSVIAGIWHSGIGYAHPRSAVGAAGRAAIVMLEAAAATAAAAKKEEA